ncbi:MAG: DNA polymerase I [Alphaproteobacteria bacterium]
MKKKICLIDGSGYIFRAFYGIPPMNSPEGTPVNAVYGFVNMYMKLAQKMDCTHSVVVFDAARKNFRNDIYADYKANRLEPPEDLVPQFAIIREVVDALNLHRIEMEGYEADDLIATLVEKAKKEGYEATVVSADKDLMQLICEGIAYYDPMKDKYCGEAEVMEKFGVHPCKVIDVQALAGDSSDNVPGVAGIGLKTAALLINEYGSLEELLERAGEIKQNKRRESLINEKEKAIISKQLVTLKNDVEIKQSLDDFVLRKPNAATIKEFAQKYAFRSLESRLQAWAGEQSGQEVVEVKKEYKLIVEEADLISLVDEIKQKGVFAFDTETTGINPTFDEIVGISIATAEGRAFYIPINHGGDGVDLFSERPKQLSKDIIKKHFESVFKAKSILKIGHNIKFDMHFMSQVLGDIDINPIEDTCVLSYVLDSLSRGHSLDELAETSLNYKTIKFGEVVQKNQTFKDVSLENALKYAAEDADITLRLYNILKPRLISERQVYVYETFDRPLISVLQKMEREGIYTSLDCLKSLSSEFALKLAEIEKEIYQLAGVEFNIASPKQVGEVLAKVLGVEIKSTSADVLEELAKNHDLPAKVLAWRGFAKLKSTYTDSLVNELDKNNRIHTSFNQVATNTGRLASSNPNLQNIPIRSEDGAKIRACFVAKDENHKIIAVDYSQVELRILAAVADVKALKYAFEHGVDIHTQTASQVFGVPYDEVDKRTRSNAKAINFGIVYGMSEFGLANQLGIERHEAKAYIDAYFKAMPEIKEYMQKTVSEAKRSGFVTTPMGRKINIFGINDQNKRVANSAERVAINAPIQGAAADMIKKAMIKVADVLQNYKTKMLVQVHDELVFEAPIEEADEVAKIIKQAMEEVNPYDVKMSAEYGIADNWKDAH